MSRWIDSDEKPGQSTSNLPVLPPADLENQIPLASPLGEPASGVAASGKKSQSAADEAVAVLPVALSEADLSEPIPVVRATPIKQKPTAEQPTRTGTGRPTKIETPRSRPAPVRSTASPSTASPSTASPNRVVAPPPQGPSADPYDAEESDPFQLKHGIPSWLISFIVHLAALLLLAIFTIGSERGREIIGLEISTSEEATDVVSIESPVNFLDDLEDPLSSSTDLDDDKFEDVDKDEAAQQILSEMSLLSAAPAESSSTAAELIEVASGNGKSVKFFGAGAEGTRFVFVIDCSASMYDEDRWYTAKRELRRAIESLTAQQEYYVFLYNSYSFQMTKGKPRLVKATKKNRRDTTDWLETNEPIGDTRPWRSMYAALQLEPDAIFLLSDGEIKDNTPEALRRENQKTVGTATQPAVPVHTIFLGSGFGEPMMRYIAETNDGTFTRVRN